MKGYKIEKGVSIGFGSVVCADSVVIGKNSKIGFLTIIRGDTIRIGSYVEIGSMTYLDTPIQEIGDSTRINEQVFVGGLAVSRFKIYCRQTLSYSANVFS